MNTLQGFWPPKPEQTRRTPVAWMLPGEGRRPVIAEPIHATVSLEVPGKASVHALDTSGRRKATLPSETRGGRLRFDPATAESIWIEVLVE